MLKRCFLPETTSRKPARLSETAFRIINEAGVYPGGVGAVGYLAKIDIGSFDFFQVGIQLRDRRK